MDALADFYSACAQVTIVAWLAAAVETRAFAAATNPRSKKDGTRWIFAAMITMSFTGVGVSIAILGGFIRETEAWRVLVLLSTGVALFCAAIGLLAVTIYENYDYRKV